jgi:hypothetical protein
MTLMHFVLLLGGAGTVIETLQILRQRRPSKKSWRI